ncbi:MAG: response regulator transcription factor [Thermaerobacter sp.]|nr:response regulator transcription factor [Thermaerobacter sp.]
MATPLNLVIISGSPIMRVGLKAIFQHDSTFFVHADTPEELDSIVKRVANPRAFLLDIDQGEALRGAVARIAAWEMRSKVAVLASFDNESLVMESIRLGVDAILDKASNPETILESLKLLCSETDANVILISPSFWSHFVVPKILHFTDPAKFSLLTRRELEILALLDKGYTNFDIASALVISPHTVKRHVEHVLKKFDAKDRHECTRLAHSAGILHTARRREASVDTIA